MTRNKKLVKMMALAVAASTVATSVPAYAAFDATYYAQQNPDVVAAIGTKPADLETHYNVFGKKEGRAGSADEVGGSALRQLFDAEYYAKMNPDVAAVYGNDANALFSHFLQFGIKEGRRINPYFDVNAYKKAYPDLVAAFGDDIAAYYNHFATNGIKEHRTLGGFPAEKIVPGGVAVASSGGSSSSSGGGGGSSSAKPASKPAETTPAEQVTPTPDPTPTPAPEPTPEPTSQEYIEIALGIQESNAELKKSIKDYYNVAYTTQDKSVPLTQGERDALVARALNNLRDADDLKTLAATNLEVAKAENAAAQKAFADASTAVAEAAKTNSALSSFTSSKHVISNVGDELTGYYAALENVAAKQIIADQAAESFAEAKAAADEAQNTYDKAFENVKSTILIIDTTKKESDFDKKEDADVVNTLLGYAGDDLTVAGLYTGTDEDDWKEDSSWAASKLGTTIASQNSTNDNQANLKRLYANYKVGKVELITETGRVSDVVYNRLVDAKTAATNATSLENAQKAYIAGILTDTSNYTSDGSTGFVLGSAAKEKLVKLGFGTSDPIFSSVTTAGTAAISIPSGKTFAEQYPDVAKKLTADSDEIKESKFNAGITAIDNTATGKKYAELADAAVKAAIKTDIDDYINAYKATVAGAEYDKAYDAINDVGTGTKDVLDLADSRKKSADEALKEATDKLSEADEAVIGAEAERDEAYEAQGVAGNAELIKRDEAQKDAIEAAYEERMATKANTQAKKAYDDADENYDKAAALVATQ